MTANALHAFGTLLKMGDGGSPEVFTTIAEMREIPVPALEGAMIDVTTHEQSSRVRSQIPNLPSLPDLAFDIFYIPDEPTHDENTGLLSKCISGDVTNFRVVYNTTVPKQCDFSGYVTRFVPRAPVDNVWSANVRINVAEIPTWS